MLHWFDWRGNSNQTKQRICVRCGLSQSFVEAFKDFICTPTTKVSLKHLVPEPKPEQTTDSRFGSLDRKLDLD